MEKDETTNPPFAAQKGKPPLHLRDWTAAEVAQYIRLRDTQEAGRKAMEQQKEKK